MAAHTYWRLYIGAKENVYAQMGTVSFLNAAQVNQSTGGTATASSEYGGSPWVAGNAFDGNPASEWASAGVSSSEWIAYQHPSPVDIVAVGVKVSVSYPVSGLALQYSDDGVSWSAASPLYLLAGQPALDSGSYTVLGTGTSTSRRPLVLVDGRIKELLEGDTLPPQTPATHSHATSDVTGLDAALAGKEPTISAGTTAQYWRGNKAWRDFFTDVRAATLTGLSTATNAVITAADTVLSALGKLQKQVSDNLTTLTSHTGNTSNPHGVTKAQVGLGNVDNTADSAKPVSTAQQTALDTKQDTLVSGTNIKTVNGNSLLGSGDLSVPAGISDAPSDGKVYGRKDAGWAEAVTPGIDRAAKTSAYTLVGGDKGALIDCSGTWTLGFTAAATLGAGWWCYVRNTGTGTITADPNASELIDGVTSGAIKPGMTLLIQCDGAAFHCVRVGPHVAMEVLTSGTSWTCPLGVRTARFRLTNGGSVGGIGNELLSGPGGSGGSTAEFTASITPGTAYTYAIGASAGTTQITINGTTYTGYSAQGAGKVIAGLLYFSGSGPSSAAQPGGQTVTGFGQGGAGVVTAPANPGQPGGIILEY